jgi:D-alanyl-D-alanine carboxypeptidase
MVDLLVAMLKTPVGDLFVNSLKDKDVGRAHGHVKTGSLAIANCLVGYVDPPGGHRLAFAILLNAGEANGIGWAVKVRDRIYQAIGE